VTQQGRTFHVNGLYRHGFLLAPAMAGEVARLLLEEGKQSERRAS
jgi:glycine oxidase